MDLHRLAEERSIAMHREVAARLRARPDLVERARERVGRWLQDESVARPYAEAWLHLLEGPREQLLSALIDPSEHMRALRQVTPFAGVLDPRTRWQIHRATAQRVRR